MLATTRSASLLGFRGHPISVEVHCGSGVPGYAIVGLPDTSCRESRDRVRAALLSTGEPWPNVRITVNLAPTGLPKVGAALDLAIAVAILAADQRLATEGFCDIAFFGELGLDGTVRSVPGVLPLVAAVEAAVTVVPWADVDEARLITRTKVIGVRSLREVIDALRGDPWPPQPSPASARESDGGPDLSDVRGQPIARLALEVAAAGGHHLLMCGPPGGGKTMLARRLPGLLPPLDDRQALEVSCVHSAAGQALPKGGLIRRPPLRAPHHSASMVSLVGGGSTWLRPGEISLAHSGVLFMDELGEFPANVLDALRQPIEEGVIRLSRALRSTTLPSRFVLVAAMNPCPCGQGGTPAQCRCSDAGRARYFRRISGPLLDRFDLRIQVNRPDAADLVDGPPGEPTASVRARVLAARERARERGVAANALLSPAQIDDAAPLDDASRSVLERALRTGRLSARGYQRVRLVARTLADLERSRDIDSRHVALALSLRANLFESAPEVVHA